MKKLRKPLLWISGILAGLLLLLVIGLWIFFPAEKAKNYALQRAEQQLGRKVLIESVNLSFRGGLGLRLGGVEIGNPEGFAGGPSPEPLLTTESVDLMVAIRPLWKKEIRAHSLIINRPVVTARKLADGTDNFTFTPAIEPDLGAHPSKGQGTAPVNASIDRIEVNDGRVRFADESAGTGVRITGLELRSGLTNSAANVFRIAGTARADSLLVSGEQPVPPLSPSIEFTVNYDQQTRAVDIADATLDLNGIVMVLTGGLTGSGDDLQARGHLTAERITIDQLLALAPPEALAGLRGARISGFIDLACDLDYQPLRPVPLDYRGNLTVSNLVLEQPDIAATLNVLSATAEFRPDYLVLHILQAKAGGEPFTGQVEIQDFLNPRIQGQLAGAVDLALAKPYLDPKLEADLAGRSTFDVSFSGSVDDPDLMKVTGNLGLQNVRFSANTLHEPIRKLDGKIDFSRTLITVRELTASTPSSAFALSGTMKDPLPYFLPPELQDSTVVAPRPTVQFVLKSRRLDVDRLFPPASPGPVSAATAGDPVVLVDFPDIIGQGTVSVDTMIYSKVEFTSLAGRVEIRDRTIHCLDAKGQVYTGKVAGRTSVDLGDMNRPRYSGEFAAQQIEAADFLTRFTKFGGLFYGKFDMSGSFSAAGLKPEEIQNTLNLDSQAAMKDGKVVTSGFAYSSLSTLAGKAGQTFQKEQTLKNLATRILAKNGKVILEQLKSGLGSLGDLSVSGAYGFAGDLDFLGTLLLSEAQTRKMMESGGLTGKVAGLLGSAGAERLALPITIGGTIKKPSMSVDYSVLAAGARETLQDDLKKEAADKLKGWLK